jgi:hypothetical protein
VQEIQQKKKRAQGHAGGVFLRLDVPADPPPPAMAARIDDDMKACICITARRT